MKPAPIQLDTEKNITELTIASDGRVFAFGTSRQVLEVLCAIAPQDQRVRRMLQHVRVRAQPKTGDIA